jgi:threonine aldolase
MNWWKSERCAGNTDLRYHLDGARLFNALAVTDQTTFDYGKLFDSISICLSKGLGAPVGSMLSGSKEFIHKARRFRRAFGGGMRQAGYLAAAGIYALDHHIERLKDDHQRAQQIAEALSGQSWVKEVLPVETNIVIFLVPDEIRVPDLVQKLEEKGILTVQFDHNSIRMVTHLDIDDEMVEYVVEFLGSIDVMQ